MREYRSSGSVEGVLGNWHSYSDVSVSRNYPKSVSKTTGAGSTGRFDRIRCKVEIARRPIVVYEPYLGGSAYE